MKKFLLVSVVLLLLFGLIACSDKSIKVTSDSINAEGKLLTICATTRFDPPGENLSPQLSWEDVPEAGCYAVIMFDEDADWLHWYLLEVNGNSLEQGAYKYDTRSTENCYVGPYPSKNAGPHRYMLEVFALKQASDSFRIKFDGKNNYDDIVKGLDTANGSDGNIISRGYVVGTYENGDDTQA